MEFLTPAAKRFNTELDDYLDDGMLGKLKEDEKSEKFEKNENEKNIALKNLIADKNPLIKN